MSSAARERHDDLNRKIVSKICPDVLSYQKLIEHALPAMDSSEAFIEEWIKLLDRTSLSDEEQAMMIWHIMNRSYSEGYSDALND